MSNLRFQNALQGIPQAVPPVWFMRQAGRYHQHYQKLKEKYSFEDLCKNPELAARTAMGPIEDFDFDLAILFSDILFPLEALGMGLRYNPGPQFDWQIQGLKDLELLIPVDDAIGNLQFQKKAVQLTRSMLPTDKSLIGFVGGLYTLFSYATVGKHNGREPLPLMARDLRDAFLPILEELLVQNIELQLAGGAEIVMIFDTAAGSLSPHLFRDIVLPGLQRFVREFPGKIGYYALGVTRDHHSMLSNLKGLAGYGMDHRFAIEHSLAENEGQKFIQGNFDQSLLFLNTSDFERCFREWLAPIKELAVEERAGWVCGLGHGVLPGTPEKHVRLFVEKIRETFG
ncbi:MAG: uroporphyrinogen decarboxylase [Leptospiraceae bacterium]|nr:uroporphyrinogen decarboxylase [Leptospiraceae bacterium]